MHIRDLPPHDLQRVAEVVGLSYHGLRQFKYKPGWLSAEAAIQIEKAGLEVGILLPREEHAKACSECEFARECRASTAPLVGVPTCPIEISITQTDDLKSPEMFWLHAAKALHAAGVPLELSVSQGTLEWDVERDLAGVGEDEVYTFRWKP